MAPAAPWCSLPSAEIVPDDTEIVERHMGERRASRAVAIAHTAGAVVSSLSFTLT